VAAGGRNNIRNYKFTEFTEASSTADTAGMSRHRLALYTVHYLKTLLILAIINYTLLITE